MRVRPALGLLLAVTTVASTVLSGSLVTAAPAQASTSCVPPPVAHRGDSARAPENTMPAFRSALRVGVRTIETDVQFTSDGVPVLMHDLSLARTTDGTGTLAELTFEQARTLDAGRAFSRRFAGTRVPSMLEMLVLARSRGARVQLELKVRPTPEQLATFLMQLRQTTMGRSVIVNSFDPQTVLDVRAAAPDLATAIVDNPKFRDSTSVLSFGQTYIVNEASVTASRVAGWRKAGIAVRPWVVDSVAGWRRMAFDRAAATITNDPSRYLAWARSTCR